MSTTTVKTIGSGGDYTTLQAWEDAAAANLTTSIAGGEIWEGQIKAASDAFSSASNLLTVSGSTTDATGFKRLTTAAGASFRNNANVQTNALRFNASNGCAITLTAGYASAVIVDESFAQFSKLQVASTTAGAGGIAFNTAGVSRTNLDVDGCIFETGSTGGAFLSAGSFGGKVRNCLIVTRAASASRVAFAGNTVDFYNCTFAVPSDLTAATVCFSGSYGTVTAKNCAFFGVSAVKSGTSTYTFTTCYSDDAAPPTGVTTTGYATGSGAKFQNITDATRDYRIQTGSSLADAGTTDSTNAATDIAGTSRPSGSAYDVGAWEFVSAGGGGVTYPQLERGIRGLNRGVAQGSY